MLSEGIFCKGGNNDGREGGGGVACPEVQLRDIYSETNFIRTYSIVRARDWVLPMYGQEAYMMAPLIDMMNYGQVGP